MKVLARSSMYAARVRRGTTLLLTLAYVLMFGALATSMVAFSQGNVMVQGADTDMKTALTGAESGMSYLLLQLRGINLPTITEGSISSMTTPSLLWSGTNIEGQSGNNGIAVALAAAFNASKAWGSGVTPVIVPTGTNALIIPEISLDTGNTGVVFSFKVAWDSGNPYLINSQTSIAKLHLTSTGRSNSVSRSVTMDFWVQKQLKYAVYSNVAIQLGKNVHVIGDVASTYNGTNKGPPVQMFSDYHYLSNSGNIDSTLATFRGLLATYDGGHVNRLDMSNPAASAAAATAGLKDVNGDGYIDDSDIALQKFGTKVNPGASDPWGINKADFTDPTTGKLYDPDLFTLIDAPMGSVTPAPWTGYGDNVIDYHDPTAKVTGNVKMALSYSSWQSAASGWQQWGDTTGGTAGTTFNDQFEGTVASSDANPVQFGVDFTSQQTLTPQNFDTSSYDAKVPSGTATKSGSTISNGTLTLAMADKSGGATVTVVEHSPASATSGWQATYSRPTFTNVTFNNVRIPAGLNAKFVNCTFNGYTSVKMNTAIVSPNSSQNTNSDGTTPDPNGGMAWAQKVSGTNASYTADGVKTVSGSTTTVTPLNSSNSTAFTQGNNLHFNGCTFNGVLTADVPTAYTHFADSWEFDGTTTFTNTVDPSVTIEAPNTNIEMGGFTNPGANPSTLVGVVVAGNVDIRGTANVDGSLIVTGAGATNTTLGYFGSTDQGQAVPPPSQLPGGASTGYGHLYFQLNTSRGMPNGISIPVVGTPQYASYQIQ